MSTIWTPEFKDTHKFYSCPSENVERLQYTSLDESVYCNLDGRFTAEEIREMIESEETIEVTAWERDMPSRGECGFLDDLLERIEADRNPNGKPIEKMDVLKAAEQAFIDVLLANYEPWACEQVETISVNIEDWINNLSDKERVSLLGDCR
jgi:hypothetical protein